MFDDETNDEGIETDEVAPVESHAHERPQRRRRVPRRIKDCKMMLDSVVSNERDLIHFALMDGA